MKHHTKKPRKLKSTTLKIRLTEELKQEVEKAAYQAAFDVSFWVRQALREAVRVGIKLSVLLLLLVVSGCSFDFGAYGPPLGAGADALGKDSFQADAGSDAQGAGDGKLPEVGTDALPPPDVMPSPDATPPPPDAAPVCGSAVGVACCAGSPKCSATNTLCLKVYPDPVGKCVHCGQIGELCCGSSTLWCTTGTCSSATWRCY